MLLYVNYFNNEYEYILYIKTNHLGGHMYLMVVHISIEETIRGLSKNR
jgi:hypothetical protein